MGWAHRLKSFDPLHTFTCVKRLGAWAGWHLVNRGTLHHKPHGHTASTNNAWNQFLAPRGRQRHPCKVGLDMVRHTLQPAQLTAL